MPGTKHFSRMQYNVARGLREIVAPRQTMGRVQWEQIREEFGGRCIFCGQSSTKDNRGIVPDHLIPVTRFGELVVGNTVPACQTCNDSRGEKEWRPFLRERFPGDAEAQIAKVEQYLVLHPYCPSSPERALSESELRDYTMLLTEWDSMLQRARRLQSSVERRRKEAAREGGAGISKKPREHSSQSND